MEVSEIKRTLANHAKSKAKELLITDDALEMYNHSMEMYGGVKKYVFLYSV